MFEDDDILTISAVGCTECTQKSKHRHRGQKSLGAAQRETQKAGTDLSFIGLYIVQLSDAWGPFFTTANRGAGRNETRAIDIKVFGFQSLQPCLALFGTVL